MLSLCGRDDCQIACIVRLHGIDERTDDRNSEERNLIYQTVELDSAAGRSDDADRRDAHWM